MLRELRDERPVEREDRLLLVAFAERLPLLERLRALLRAPRRLAGLVPARLERLLAARRAAEFSRGKRAGASLAQHFQEPY